jgi:hypothetical protein
LKTAHLDLRVEPELIEAIDAWRNRHQVPPSRARTIAYMLAGWLEERGCEPIIETPLSRRRGRPK